jgi:hypothetical protein
LFKTTVGGELSVDIYTYDPSASNFQSAHVTFAGTWFFPITQDMVPASGNKYVTLNFHKVGNSIDLTGGKYYIALIGHQGGKNNHFCYLENRNDYDFSTRVKGNFGTPAGDRWFNAGTQIITELNFDKSLSTNDLQNDITVGFIAPNPTSGETTLGFTINAAQDVTIEIVDLAGKTMLTKVEKGLAAGSHLSSFDASALSSGVYCVNIKTDSAVSTQKFIKN